MRVARFLASELSQLGNSATERSPTDLRYTLKSGATGVDDDGGDSDRDGWEGGHGTGGDDGLVTTTRAPGPDPQEPPLLVDPLTGLSNRTAGMRRIEDLLAGESDVGVLFVNLDDFRQPNLDLGYSVGDAMLCVIGHRLRSLVGFAGMVCRVGRGNDFVICLPNGDVTELADLADRVLAAIRRPFTAAELVDEPTGVGRVVTAHVGSALAVAGDTVDSLMRRADTAMHLARRPGDGTLRTDCYAAYERLPEGVRHVPGQGPWWR